MLYMGALVLFVAAILFLGFFTVPAGRAVVALRWGRFDRVFDKPGLYFLFPIGRGLTSVPVSHLVYEAEEVGVNAEGDQVCARGQLGYCVSDPRKAVLDVEKLRDFVQHQVAVVLRAAAPRQDAAGLAAELQERLARAGVTVREFQVDFEVLLHEEVMRPAAARAWARSVVVAHEVLQEQAIRATQSVQEATEKFPKAVRGDVLNLAVVSVDSVASNLPKPHAAA